MVDYPSAGKPLHRTVREVVEVVNAGSAGYTDEQAQDAFAALLAAGTHIGITFTYDDANNRLSAAVTGSGGGSTTPRSPEPDWNGLKGWSYDPLIINGASAMTSGVLWVSRMHLRAGTITNLLVNVNTTAGSGLTAGQNFMALFDDTGAQVAVTGDLSAVWNSLGVKTCPLSSPVTVTEGFYYGAVLANGTTPPTLSRGAGGGFPNIGTPTGKPRGATTGSGLTAIPASVTPSSYAATSNAPWIGAS